MIENLIIYDKDKINSFISHREGELKLGEKVQTILPGSKDLATALTAARGAKFVLLGIPESIGISANFGIPNSNLAWEYFLKKFLNIQSNRYLKGSDIICLGHIDSTALNRKAAGLTPAEQRHLQLLRSLTEELDNLIAPVIASIAEAGMIPVVIGGGHNNAYPLLKGVCKGFKAPSVNCINLDPHADFRALEGRHSGNGFSYAFEEGYINRYFITGLHENYNSESIYQRIEEANQTEEKISYNFFEDMVSGKKDFATLLNEAINFVFDKKIPTAIELDMDAIAAMPASASTPSGVSLEQARQYVSSCARTTVPAYLHIAEAATSEDEQKNQQLGKALSYLVADFIKSAK